MLIHGFGENLKSLTKKKIIISFALLLVTELSLLAVKPASANSTIALVYLDPPTITGNVGDIFNVTIMAKNFAILNTWQAGLSFDPDALEALDVYSGNDIADDVFDLLAPGNTTIWFEGAPFNTEGYVSYTAVSLAGGANVTGTPGTSYKLMTVKFRLKMAGTFEAHLRDVMLLTPSPDQFNIPLEILDYFTPSWGGTEYLIAILTNSTGDTDSTIRGHYFNQTLGQIGFNITCSSERNFGEGVVYTDGFCNVTIPTNFMWGTFTVKLNDVTTSFTESTNGTHKFIYFTYVHGPPYSIKIESTEVIPEFNSLHFLLLLLITAIAVITARKFVKKIENKCFSL
jgi:hypothetical protein